MLRLNNRIARFGALSALFSLSTGCTSCEGSDEPLGGDDIQNDDDGGPDTPEPPRSVQLCDEELSEAEFARFLDGNLVIVAAFSDEGSSKARAIADLVIALVFNGIDFANLGNARPSFADGRYGLATGDSELGFQLFFAQDFEDFAAGDPIPHNVFDPDSYARNIQITIDTNEFPPTASIDWDPGPLAGLVEGEIDINETSGSVRVRLRTDLVDIQVDSGSPYTDTWELGDALWLQMRTTRVNIAAMAGDLQDAGFGFSYDDTTYDSPVDEMSQAFYDSEFSTLQMDNGNYRWEGGYRSTVTKRALTMYQDGFASNAGSNYTDYFCDAELTQKVGSAEHDDSLRFGWFVFEDGTRFPYGLH